MTNRDKAAEPGTRQRIFDAAVRLFARHGYEAVGIRDIAREAGGNIAGANYHFGGKVELLKAILERYNQGYWSVLYAVGDRNLPVRPYIRATVEALVRFYRENTELALAAENAGASTVPEARLLAARLRAVHRERNNRYFRILGVDLDDPAAMTVMRGLLTIVISRHFHARYEQEVVAGPPQGLTPGEREKLPELSTKYDDAFYERFTGKLAAFYLGGVRAIRAERSAPRPRKKAE